MKKMLTKDLRREDEDRVLTSLESRGVSPQDYAAIASDASMLADIIAVINNHRFFTKPQEQVQRLLEFNEVLWKEPWIEKAVRRLGKPPKCPTSDKNGLYCVHLNLLGKDQTETLERNWQACVYVHGERGTHTDLQFTRNTVRSKNCVWSHDGEALFWVVVELGRKHKGLSEIDTRIKLAPTIFDTLGFVNAMASELALIAALHPKWAMAMNGTSFPFVSMIDMEVFKNDGRGLSYMPVMRYDQNQERLCLESCRTDISDPLIGAGYSEQIIPKPKQVQRKR